ncbi:MAG: hypothetical protein QUU85_01550, partial [Candidatus Eisenbacteria bacterium]|nr:hypothetical protein [Candidatus Eisenbacteria bacterium]
MSADRRMRDLHRLVESGRYEILSLDLFDTVLWRMVPEPVDVHFLVARRLLDGGSIHDSSSIESYVTERVRAEERARKAKKTTPEVTLAEIFAEFPAGYLRGISPAQAAEVEFEVERSVVRVDAGMAGLIGEARRRGLKIAFVSDTYFERRQIEALATIPADHLILSCEHGLSKYAGLHRVLLERSRVAGDRILHVGNDYRSDVEGPGVFGIERFWYRKYPDPFTGMVGRELPRTYTLRRDLVSSSDLGLTTLRGRAMFHCGDDEHAAWGAGVLGPIVCGFADWVVEKARSLGIERLLCLMREGRILKRVIDGAIDGPVGAIDGSGGSSGGLANSANRIETVELFASRYAALRAAIFEGTEEEIASFVHRPTPQPLERILTQLGLDPRDLDAGDPVSYTHLTLPTSSE